MSLAHRWLSIEQWRERIITFDASWFIVTMGTGIMVQNLHLFPWPAQWLTRLSYVFWVLDMVLFAFFVIMGTLRLLLYPKISLNVINDFQQTSFMGAIPISLDNITAGLIIHYSSRAGAIYAAQVFFWIGVFLTLLVSCGGIFAMYQRQGQHKLNEVTGVWLLTFIPLIVTAALGSTLAPHLMGANAAAVIAVSFMMVSAGLGICLLILGIYLWRLMACSLPARDAIVSCFVPVGPLGMGAFAILGLAIDLAAFVSETGFLFRESQTAAIDASSRAAVAQMIEWMGIIVCFALLGLASFFLLEAFASVFAKLPRTFNIGFWSFVFPCGVYSNAFCYLSTTLRNNAARGWASACVVGTILLWLMCATLTVYKGIWCGKLFVAPGLQGFVEQRQLDHMKKDLGDFQDLSGSQGLSSSTENISGRRYVVSADGTFKGVPCNVSDKI